MEILKPCSTKSKIVVQLNDIKKRRKDEPLVRYEIDPYDEFRLRIVMKDEELLNRYHDTISQLSDGNKLCPTGHDMKFTKKEKAQ